jgi:hypothetical protein
MDNYSTSWRRTSTSSMRIVRTLRTYVAVDLRGHLAHYQSS